MAFHSIHGSQLGVGQRHLQNAPCATRGLGGGREGRAQCTVPFNAPGFDAPPPCDHCRSRRKITIRDPKNTQYGEHAFAFDKVNGWL